MRNCALVAIVAAVAAGATVVPATAEETRARPPWLSCVADADRPSPWSVNWAMVPVDRSAASKAPAPLSLHVGTADIAELAGQSPPQRRRTVAFEYSEGYKIRAKIHRIASLATLPIFAAQYLVGTNLYNHPDTRSDAARSAHEGLVAGTAVLFGVNTTTGVWNLIEARKDPNRSTKRTIHAVLMLLADAGFVATGATAPESEHDRLEGGGGSRSTHRALALTSMGMAAVSYLLMLLGGN